MRQPILNAAAHMAAPAVATESMDLKPAFDSTRPFAFLGGTVGDSTWRDTLKGMLTVNAFDPVVDDWTVDDAKAENEAKASSSLLVYCITPKQKGFYVIAEATAACAGTRHKDVVFILLREDDGQTFDEHQAASVEQIKELLLSYSGVHYADNLEEAARIINNELAG